MLRWWPGPRVIAILLLCGMPTAGCDHDAARESHVARIPSLMATWNEVATPANTPIVESVVSAPAVRVLPTPSVPLRGFTLCDVTVVNPGVGRMDHQTVTVRDSHIESIRDRATDCEGAELGRRFAGGYILPGLVDLHVHHPRKLSVGETELVSLLFLANGVTTVRDTGNGDGGIFTTRRQINNGAFPGPRIFACGNILDGEPRGWSWSCSVTSRAEAERCVAEQVSQGADCIKVYDNLTPESLASVREAAALRGLPVIGHVPRTVPFERAAIDDVQHLTGVLSLAPPPPGRQIAEYFDWVVEAWRELDDERIDFIVRTSKVQGIDHTPTLVLWDRMARRLANYKGQLDDPAAHLLPREYREDLWNPESLLSRLKPETIANFPAAVQKMRYVVRRLHEAGVRIHVGTDTPNPFVVPGVSLHEELHNLISAGFTPEEAWVAATRSAGAALRTPLLGTLQEGAPADLLVFRDDPTRDLGALSTLDAVAAQGRPYLKADLDAAVARYLDFLAGKDLGDEAVTPPARDER